VHGKAVPDCRHAKPSISTFPLAPPSATSHLCHVTCHIVVLRHVAYLVAATLTLQGSTLGDALLLMSMLLLLCREVRLRYQEVDAPEKDTQR
jgi:hypothetical protein